MHIHCKSLAAVAALLALLLPSDARHPANADQVPSTNDAAIQAEIEQALRDGTTDDIVILEAAKRAIKDPSEIDSLEAILRSQFYQMVADGLLSKIDVENLDAVIRQARSREVSDAELRNVTQPILDEKLKHNLIHRVDKCRTESSPHVPHAPEEDNDHRRSRFRGRLLFLLEVADFAFKVLEC